MTPTHARYPFLSAAREAVADADLRLPALVAEDAPAVERGVERVERALLDGTTAPETPGRWDVRAELLSYPVARVLVSLLDVPAAVEKYAAAEAATARERFDEALAGGETTLRSVGERSLSRGDLLAEFDLADVVRREPGDGPGGAGATGGAGGGRDARFRVGVGAYLRLSTPEWGGEWRLAVRELAAGEVRVTREELHRLLQEAVRRRVAEGLPFDVRASAGGAEIADALADDVGRLRDLLSDRDPVPATAVDVVEPDLFPPCVRALLERAREEGPTALDPEAAFALDAFCAAIGMAPEDAAAAQGATGEAAEAVTYRATYLADRRGSQYPPPSCATMQANGDCVPVAERDERCEAVASPLAYYAEAVAAAGLLDDADDADDAEATGVDGAERDAEDGDDAGTADADDGASRAGAGAADAAPDDATGGTGGRESPETPGGEEEGNGGGGGDDAADAADAER
jgi:DNA primase large subunit